MRDTIKDIASKTHVSISTVSKCLNGYGEVSENTKKQVFDTIKELDYVPNTFARYMSTHSTKIIGLTVPDVRDPYFAQSTLGIEERLQKSGYQLFLANLNRNSKKLLEFIQKAREMRFDGFIFTTDSWSEDVTAVLKRMDIPLLSLRRRPPESLHIPYIDSDHYQGAMELMGYLYRKGHRKIGHVVLPSETGALRLQGYRNFCENYRLEDRSVQVDIPAHILSDSVRNGHQATKEIFSRWPDTTAVFAASDFLAIGSMEFFYERHLEIPTDISLVGIGNMEYAQLPWFNFTTMELHRYEMGVQAAEMLLKMIDGEKVQNVLFPEEFIERKSVSKLA